MLKNKIVEGFVENLKDTDNIGTTLMYSKRDYLELYKVVMDVLKRNKDADISEIREELYKRSGVEEIVRKVYLEQLKAPGAVMSFGTCNHQERIIVGNKQEIVMNNGKVSIDLQEMDEDTIFDLASCTKLFTAVAMLKLALRPDVELKDQVTKYVPEFKNLQGVTLHDLLMYLPLITEGRIDNAKDKEEAEKILLTARVKTPEEMYQKSRYNDIAPMVLKYVIEKITGMNLYDYISQTILQPTAMTSTYVKVPGYALERVANNNYAIHLLPNGSTYIDQSAPIGTVTDKKAAILGQPEGNLSGHAGLFSTVKDMVNFSQGMIHGLIIHPAMYREMAKNRTQNDRVKYDGFIYTPSYGYLCNVKNNDPKYTAIYPGLSGQSVCQTGWSGSFVGVDKLNGINVTLLSNRTHNRVLSYPDGGAQRVKQLGLVDASNYYFDRKLVTDICSRLALQERMLEEIIGDEIKNTKTEKVRILK
ncbi:MAG: beta-lactamase family protein [Bacilli bacterium]|nr:beta-lactamase family protein [Bacilli bacterium]